MEAREEPVLGEDFEPAGRIVVGVHADEGRNEQVAIRDA
jgi:hypothetical protein